MVFFYVTDLAPCEIIKKTHTEKFLINRSKSNISKPNYYKKFNLTLKKHHNLKNKIK